MYGSVKVWQEIISLPTWTTGAEDPGDATNLLI